MPQVKTNNGYIEVTHAELFALAHPEWNTRKIQVSTFNEQILTRYQAARVRQARKDPNIQRAIDYHIVADSDIDIWNYLQHQKATKLRNTKIRHLYQRLGSIKLVQIAAMDSGLIDKHTTLSAISIIVKS
jgi:hypothetical protein